MRWKTRYSKKSVWHPWFAWFPIYLGGGQRVWCEVVERRVKSNILGTWWEYREVSDD